MLWLRRLVRPALSAIAISALACTATASANPTALTVPSWTTQPSPNAPGATVSVLEAVSCTVGGDCQAIGYSGSSTGGTRGLALGTKGSTWDVESMQGEPDAKDIQMTAVACTSGSWCDAVGYSVDSGKGVNDLNIVEHWNGAGWTIVKSPEPGSPGNRSSGLSGISCSSSNYCLAVGGYVKNMDDPSDEEQPFALQWDGSSWTMLDAPNPDAENGSSFSAVSCIDAGVCEVTGDFDYADIAQSIFAYSYSSTVWKSQTQKNPEGQEFNQDNAVSCTAPDACSSVGYWTSIGPQPLVERYVGSGWSVQRVPIPKGASDGTDEVTGISCVSDHNCAAVGQWTSDLNDYPSAAMALTWNGSTWQLDSTSNPNGNSSLNAVSCVTAVRCVGVGASSPSTNHVTTLIESTSD